MTGALAILLEMDGLSTVVGEDFSLKVRVLDSTGPNSGETQLGPDMCVVVRLQNRDVEVTKGFLLQAKRLGTSGLRFRPALGKPPRAHSHWLWHGSRAKPLPPSGTISISRPSRLLFEQCTNMLHVTPESYVIVYGSEISVVSAMAVRAAFAKPPRSRDMTSLGTKRLADFFVNVLDCFIGDQRIRAWDNESLLDIARANRARHAMLVQVAPIDRDVSDNQEPWSQ